MKILKPIEEFTKTKHEYLSIYLSLQNKITLWTEEINNDQFIKSLENVQNQINESLEKVNEYIERDNEEEMWKAFTSFKKVLYNLLLFDNHYENFKRLFLKCQHIQCLLNTLKN